MKKLIGSLTNLLKSTFRKLISIIMFFSFVQRDAKVQKKLRNCHAYMGSEDTHNIVSDELLENIRQANIRMKAHR